MLDLTISSPDYMNDDSLDVDAERKGLVGSTPYPRDSVASSSMLDMLMSSDSEDEIWFDRRPPSDINDDEDVDELLK